MEIKPTSSPAIDYLKNFPNWVCWKLVEGKKIPVNPHTGGNAQSNNIQTWGTYEQAKKRYYLGAKDGNECHGLAFMITKDTGLVFIDLDDRPNPVFFDGHLTKWAYDIVKAIGSYTEVSPSGNGLHIFAFGEIPENIYSKPSHGVEMYFDKRFPTMTGKHLPFTPNTIEKRQDAINALYDQYKPPPIEYKPVSNYQYNDNIPSTDDVADMLRYISLPLGYEEWNTICMAVHSAYPNDAGINLIVNWSGQYFKEENPHLYMRSKFKSYNIGGGVTIATLIKIAKQYGYTPPTLNQGEPSNNHSEHDTSVSKQSNDIIVPDIVTFTKEEHSRLLEAEYWRGYHDGMTDLQMQTWQNLGIPEFTVNELKLGFRCESIDNDTGEIKPDCLSVPYFQNDTIANVEYRSLYNNQVTYDIDTPVLYNTVPELPKNIVCLFDDTLDSIKSWLNYGTIELNGDRLHFMALPKNKLSINSLDVLTDVNRIYILCGKDAVLNGRGLELLKSYARIIRLPSSIDTVCQHASEKDFVSLLRSGSKW